VVTPRFSQLSPGGQMLVRDLGRRPVRLLSSLGPLYACVDPLIERGLIERCRPGRAPANTAIRLTEAGRQLLQKELP
jgi:hypothetical protein